MIEVDSGTFETEVLQSAQPVVVDFWGPRCASCLALMPQVEKLESGWDGRAKFVKVDASKNRRLCLDLKVIGLPTYVFYKNGEAVGRVSGSDTRIQDIEEQLVRIVNGADPGRAS